MTYISYNDSIKNRNRRTYNLEKGTNLTKEELQKVFEDIRGNRYSIKQHLNDKKDYEEYINGQLENKTNERIAEMKIYDTLLALGFSFEDIGTFYYKELILEIAKSLDKQNTYGKEICDEQTLREMLMNRYSSIYIEKAKYNLNISSDTFHRSIRDAISNIDITKVDKELLAEIFAGHENVTTYQEQALYIGKYIQNKYLKEIKTLEMLMA